MARFRLSGGVDLLQPFEADGTTPNPAFTLITYAMVAGGRVRADESGFVIEGLETDGFWPRRMLNKLLQTGLEVNDYPVWLEMTPTRYAANVPAYVKGSTDEQGNPIPWSSWKDDAHEHYNVGGKWYVGGNSFDGVELPLSVVKQLAGVAGITVKTKAELPALGA